MKHSSQRGPLTACSCMGRQVKEKAAMRSRMAGGSRPPMLYTTSFSAGLPSFCGRARHNTQ